MKRLSADDSAGSRVKVGHRQATYLVRLYVKNPLILSIKGFFAFALQFSPFFYFTFL